MSPEDKQKLLDLQNFQHPQVTRQITSSAQQNWAGPPIGGQNVIQHNHQNWWQTMSGSIYQGKVYTTSTTPNTLQLKLLEKFMLQTLLKNGKHMEIIEYCKAGK